MGTDLQLRRARHGGIPPSLQPVLRAYLLSHVTTTGPRLFGFLRVVVRKDVGLGQKLKILYKILRTSVELTRFPAAGTLIVAGATIIPRLIRSVLQWLLQAVTKGSVATELGAKALSRIRFITTFLSAWLAFNLLNKNQAWTRRRATSIAERRTLDHEGPTQYQIPLPPKTVRWSGKTIDFTLFAFCRAIDTLVHQVWTTTKSRPSHPANRSPRIANILQNVADPLAFAVSTSIIMFAWFYAPERLPKGYSKWISTAAGLDDRILQILRLFRQGNYIYGKDTGHAPIMGSLCHDLNLPETLGDPKITIPVPCELVHQGSGPNCEFHAMSRFLRTFVFAMNLYIPLQLLARGKALLRTRDPYARFKMITSMLRASAQSSAFIASFTGMFYYTVCIVRTRLPQLYSAFVLNSPTAMFSHRNRGTKPVPVSWWQRIDSGICITAGCLTCGLSVFVETPPKRMEISQFVIPRAVATLLPRVYDARHAWKERLVFASSVAVVLTELMSRDGGRKHVRGVFGNALGQVLKDG